jgi:acetoin utilization protein AcuC
MHIDVPELCVSRTGAGVSRMMEEMQKQFLGMKLWPVSAFSKKREAILFSPCTEEDLDPLTRMYDTFEPKAAIHGLPPIDAQTRVEWIKSTLSNGINLKAKFKGDIIAQASLFPMASANMAELSIFVHNEYQNRGLGSILAELLAYSAKQVGFEFLWVFEDRNNTRALSMYHKIGFREVSRELKEIELSLDLAQIPDRIETPLRTVPKQKPTGNITPPPSFKEQAVDPDTHSVFMFSPDFERFKLTGDHPFITERSRLVYDLLVRNNLLNLPHTQVLRPDPLDESSILAFHDSKYMYYLEVLSQGAFVPRMLEYGLGTGDNPVVAGVLDYSALVCGASVSGADLLLGNSPVNLVFSPTGGLHHGGPDYAAGFCYLNDAVLAIKYLLQYGLRVIYVDIDAHHGDGVQFAFYDDPRVLNISLHESARTLFPWNSGFENELGEGGGYGYNVNVPLAPSTEDEIYREAFKRVVPPLAARFKPDVCVACIGVDTMFTDPLSHLSLTNNVYAEVVLDIRKLAPRVLMLGAGGYNASNLARDWALAWAVLHDAEPQSDYYGQVGARLAAAVTEGASLRDSHPFISTAKIAEARAEAHRVLNYIEKHIFPLHGL